MIGKILTIGLGLLILLGATTRGRSDSRQGKKEQEDDTVIAETVSLADSLDPLIEYFNANKNAVRFITLLSPT